VNITLDLDLTVTPDAGHLASLHGASIFSITGSQIEQIRVRLMCLSLTSETIYRSWGCCRPLNEVWVAFSIIWSNFSRQRTFTV